MEKPLYPISRRTGEAAKWLLAAVFILGMSAWWWPGYRTWGSLAAGLLLVLTLWFIHRCATGECGVPGHPAYLALLGPAAVLSYHLLRAEISPGEADPEGISGAMVVSVLFQLNLLAAGILCAQTLLADALGGSVGLIACAFSIAAGSVSALAWTWGSNLAGRYAWAMTGFAGACLWLLPVCGSGDAAAPGSLRVARQPGRLAAWAVAAGGVCVIVAGAAPRESLAAGVVVGLVLLICGLAYRHFRILILAGSALAVLCVVLGKAAHAGFAILPAGGVGVLGKGGDVLRGFTAQSSGLSVLAAALGWAGLLYWVVGVLACLAVFGLAARKSDRAGQGRAVIWLTLTALSVAAMLGPGGLFIPSVTLLSGVALGLLPTMTGRNSRSRAGIIVVLAIAVLAVELGMVWRMGLAEWCTAGFGVANADLFLHGAVGFLLAMSLAWVGGVRSWWLGAIGVAVAAAAGGLGELLQLATKHRTACMSDWTCHALGAAAAGVLYLLYLGSRWCEPPPGEREGQAGGDAELSGGNPRFVRARDVSRGHD